jgi:hypothetical protein
VAAKSRMKNPPTAHGAMNMASRLPVNSFTRKVPATDVTGTHTPRTQETDPRWVGGTWSARTATTAASRALRHTWAMYQPTSTTGTVGPIATTRTPREPPSRPATIHGRRMPQPERVRSLSLPKNVLANMASRAATPATSDRLLGARSVPTRELTVSASVTSSGARKSRLVLTNASA